MRLTQFSDYALRTLLYLALHREDPVPVAQVARAYGISYHHLVKVAALLTELGVVDATRGRNGGLRLAVPTESVNLGELIRKTEPDLHLVECFDAATDTCPITPACGLRHLLYDARAAFMDVLDRQTLADLLAPPGQAARLQELWLDEKDERESDSI